MSQSDSLMVEQRSRYSVLVIDGDQLSGCHALEGLRGTGVTWVSSLEDARLAMSQKSFDFILSSCKAAHERCGSPRSIIEEIIALSFRNNSPLCIIARTDSLGGQNGVVRDHLTFRAASTDNLADNMILISRNGKSPDDLLCAMKCTCTYTMPGTERTPQMWLRALEMLQSMCIRPKVELKPPKGEDRRPTPIPRK